MNWRRLTLTIPIPFQRERTVHIRLTDGGVIAATSVVIAGAVSLATDVGEGADLSLYATVAQVLPVFLLALIIEVRSRLDRSFDLAVLAIDARMDDYEQVRALEDRVRAHGVDDPELTRASAELRRLGNTVAELHEELRGYLPMTRRVVRGYVLAALPGEAGCLRGSRHRARYHPLFLSRCAQPGRDGGLVHAKRQLAVRAGGAPRGT